MLPVKIWLVLLPLSVFWDDCWTDAQVGESKVIVVAKEGTGNFSTIGEAIAAAPIHSKARINIKTEEGIYIENIVIGAEKTNLALTGDGMDKTMASGHRSVHDGIGTD